MIEQKYELPNGNMSIWLGNQSIHECDNVLILAGGDVLFLKTVERSGSEKIRADIRRLNKADFLNEYGWPNNESGNGLFLELQRLYQ